MGKFNFSLSAVVARNPVCNIASMVGVTDIPDWCFYEALGENRSEVSPHFYKEAYERSPIRHVEKINVSSVLAHIMH